MNEKNISTVTLRSPFDVSSIKIQAPYACLVYSTKDVKKEEMEKVSNWIISSGCRYAVCAGTNCSQWHDAIDWAYIASDPNYSPPESRFVMTSWHEKESLEEIVWFWLMCTVCDDDIFENYLLLIIGESEGLEEEMIKTINEIDN
ncbi:MAG: hypothetical protein HYU84_12340 [Chloroflexi bacterium]|nr:hypothetical protein [Chloroflexota bacterium]MBI3167498.1 hypothetical protein [Chloroflexota bacterium]